MDGKHVNGEEFGKGMKSIFVGVAWSFEGEGMAARPDDEHLN